MIDIAAYVAHRLEAGTASHEDGHALAVDYVEEMSIATEDDVGFEDEVHRITHELRDLLGFD